MAKTKNKGRKQVHRSSAEIMQEKHLASIVNKFELVEPPPEETPCSTLRAPQLGAVEQIQQDSFPPVPPTPTPARKRKTSPACGGLLLTVSDLCRLLSLSRSTVHRMEQAGKLPGRIEIGGAVRYHRETIESWLRGLVTPSP